MAVVVDVPEYAGPNLPGIEHRTQFLHDLGMFVGMWSEYDLAIEIIIGQLTGASPLDNATVVGTLQHGAKLQIVRELLTERGRKADADEFKEITEGAHRNTLMHGVMASDDGFSRFAIYKRALGRKPKYEATAAEFRAHVSDFRARVSALFVRLGIDDATIIEYGQMARLAQ
jgi:hypothetical protein